MHDMYLAHHGVVGQRWGIRRYQNKDGSLTPAGRKRYALNDDGTLRKLTRSEKIAMEEAEIQKRAAAQKRAVALEKARQTKIAKEKERKAQEEHEKEKQEALKTGDASKIEKYFNELSDKEVKEALARIDTKQSLQRALQSEAEIVNSGKSKMDSMSDKMKSLSTFANSAIGLYNVTAKINNAFNSGFKLNTIDGKWIRDKQKEEKKQKEEEKQREKQEKESGKKEQLLNIGSAEDLLKYAKKTGLLSVDDMAVAIKTMQNKRALETIAKGGSEAEEILKNFIPRTGGGQGGGQNNKGQGGGQQKKEQQNSDQSQKSKDDNGNNADNNSSNNGNNSIQQNQGEGKKKKKGNK